MAGNRTSISAGIIVGKLLAEDPDVSSMVTTVFPVAVAKAKLPYVGYRCRETEVTAVKAPGAPDTVLMEVPCFAAQYMESVRLAEAVRAALDFRQAETEGIRMRKCMFAGREEIYEHEAYVQVLLFRVDIR
ncbi:MAG: DUF3168 domain-containing protein [Muribaculaceae bacterium]|nr:DUF3168 domain-containing protein [Muribaculaceae bacterium]